ncbi:MAG: MFS transporter [Ferruginibacter sp.]|nr:MFS transporter [Chitinophagaceae bacterium]
MKKLKIILCFAAGHGLNDLVAGYFLGSLLHLNLDLVQVSLGLLVYNLLAFGGQYPVAIWLEKYNNPKKFLLFAYTMNTIAIALFIVAPHISVILAGVASAVYHVAGGTVCARENKAAHIGLFAAPGVVGLIAGGYFAYTQGNIIPILFAASVIFLILLILLPIENRSQQQEEQVTGSKFTLDRHDLIMILLLTVISLRSVIWNVFQLVHEGKYEWLIAIAVSAFIGKIAGGWIADKAGWRVYLFISLITATPLITLFKDEIVLFCIGIGLLQSGIPATTALLIRSVKGRTERAIGLSFGTAILAGAVVLYSPLTDLLLSNVSLVLISLLMLVLLFFSREKNAFSTR